MKLMTYNILDGGGAGIDKVIEVVNSESPDFLTINEANTFAADNERLLKEFSHKTGFEYCELALSGEYDYHVAVFSKYPFKTVRTLQPLMRACVIALIESELGEISIAGLHLTPYAEDLRHPEIDLIVNDQDKFENRILMGDMNSLSRSDGYDETIIQGFDEVQLKKFTTDGKLRFDAIEKILSKGYEDPAVKLGRNRQSTVPTTLNDLLAHVDMRLDYIFLSKSLILHLDDYYVVKNDLTQKASDHYPVVVKLNTKN